MNYYAQTIHFREVMRGDTFDITLIIDPSYPLTEDTAILMQVRPNGELEAPLLTFSTPDTITISGQEVNLHQSAEAMDIRPGFYIHDIQFTTDAGTHTLYKGIFQIIQDQSINA
jgi:hypothetical protein